MKYIPKTGPDACKRNFEMVKDYFKKNPQSTGVEIAKALSLSLPTVYRHLKKLKY
ncbi:MAG: winged helix-turn-helix domain-containing protein [Bacilli bacterium]